MARGRLDPPNLDDRTWREIVDQARALIPRYAPEWTDHNASDLGMTLIELFAWLAEGMIYRLNRVPEKNYVAFLNLLGITRAPAQPATTWLTYQLAPGSSPVTVSKGSQAATPQTEQVEGVVFETDEDLLALPINLVSALLIDDTSCRNISASLVATPLSGLLRDIEAGKTITIALGFDASSTTQLALHVECPSAAVAQGDFVVSWHYAKGSDKPQSWTLLKDLSDPTNALRRSARIRLPLLEGWARQKPASWGLSDASEGALKVDVNKELYWIGLRISNTKQQRQRLLLNHVLLNSVSATNALSVMDQLQKSDGTPFQIFELAHRPLFKQPGTANPYDHLRVELRVPKQGGDFETSVWKAVDEILPGAGQVFRLDPVTGTLYFGDFASARPAGHGRIPPAGSEILASYRYVAGGARGNVGPATVSVIRTPVAGVTAVSNPGKARDGVDEEAQEETLRQAPALLRRRTRAVTPEDYEYLAREAAPTFVAQARCLSPQLFTKESNVPADQVGKPWTYAGIIRDIGNVNLIVVPTLPLDASVLPDPRPQPTSALLTTISAYLTERCPLGAQIRVLGPCYLPIKVTVTISVWKSVLKVTPEASIGAEIIDKINRFLHPLSGGAQGQGWEIGQDLTSLDVFSQIQPDRSMGFISSLQIQAGTPAYTPNTRPYTSDSASSWVQLADYELLCSNDNHQLTIVPI